MFKHLVRTIVLMSLSHTAHAQTGMVLGGNSFAKECFQNSQTAARMGHAGRQDVEPCDRAIKDVALKRKDLVATLVNRGIIRVAMEQYQLAAKDYNRAIALQDDVGEAFLNRGNLWFLAKEFKQAEQDYNVAIEEQVQQMHVAHLNRGMVREQQGNLQGAKQDYLDALTFVENWEQALQRLDRVNKKLG